MSVNWSRIKETPNYKKDMFKTILKIKLKKS